MTIDEMLSKAQTVNILGHLRPDGDCVGSCLGLYNYIIDNYPQIDAQVFVEAFPPTFKILNGTGKILPEYDGRKSDLTFLLDTPSLDRIGANGRTALENAKMTCNIDHHISNPLNLCSENIVEPRSSSASEVLYYLLDAEKISKNAINCLYLGIVHDTGAFKFSCTGKRTMEAVGCMIDKGCDFDRIINETYYTRSFKATRITGFAMENCKLALDGKVVYSFVTPEDLKRFEASPIDLNSVVNAIREVSGTEVAIFLYPIDGQYKISLRSNYIVDVNAVAKAFGGGGHIHAAGGCTDDAPETAIQKLLEEIRKQLA